MSLMLKLYSNTFVLVLHKCNVKQQGNIFGGRQVIK